MIFGSNLAIAKQPKSPQLSFRGGDVCVLNPSGHMLREPWTSVVFSTYCPLPILPFLSLKVGRFGGYVGFKGVGWDDTYKAWMSKNSGDFLIPTIRFFTDG